MKIGILTFHNAINYGAVLQCYALKEFLVQRGHDVQVIDYRVPAIEEYKKIISSNLLSQQNRIDRKLVFLFRSLFLYRLKKRVINVFNEYLKLKLNLSKRVYGAQDVPDGYDYIFFGSDQIWNPRICKGFNPILWGQFKKNRTKFVTYAASFGELSILTEEQWMYIESHINVFDYISVREKAVRNILLEKTHKTIECCLDPTLMVDPELLRSNAIRPNIENYVLLYNITKDNGAFNFACRIASGLKCKVVYLEAKPQMHLMRKKDVIYKTGVSPDEFLGFIRYARLTVGNSFHLIALSIAMGVNFYSLNSYRPERVLNLLNMLNLANRHKESSDIPECIENIDFPKLFSKLQMAKKESLSFVDRVGC